MITPDLVHTLTSKSIAKTDKELKELSTVLYHIAKNTDVSKGYTLKFIQQSLLKASEVLADVSISTYSVGQARKEDIKVTPTNTTPPEKWAEYLHHIPTNLCTHHPNTTCDHPKTPQPCSVNPQILCYCCWEGRCYCNDQ